MKIICGTDFSPNSARAATVAAALSKRLGIPLELVHVLDETGFYTEMGGIPDEQTDEARAALTREVERLRSSAMGISDKLLQGAPDERLAELAQSEQGKLIVVSSLSRRAPERWLLGSVSERLAESASVPVLVLRGDDALLQWLEGNRKLRVVICFDSSAGSLTALDYLKELAAIGPCELIVARVDWPVSEKIRLGTGEQLQLTGNSPMVQAIVERETREAMDRTIGSSDVRVVVAGGFGRVDEHLIQIAEREGADLVVVGTHHRRGVERLWRGSVSKGVLLRSKASVLVVPTARDTATPVPSYKRVLVATDLDESSPNTIANACALLPNGGALHLLHVIAPYSLPAPIAHYGPIPEARTEHIAELARRTRAIGDLIPKDAAARRVDVSSEILEHENAVTAITQAAERMGADVICVGAHRASRLAATILGSVAQGVALCSPRPVLLVKPPQR